MFLAATACGRPNIGSQRVRRSGRLLDHTDVIVGFVNRPEALAIPSHAFEAAERSLAPVQEMMVEISLYDPRAPVIDAPHRFVIYGSGGHW